jgi:hypothetical protein
MTGARNARIVGGLPLKKFYPELGNAALWCCTELTARSAIDTVCGLLSEYEENAKTQEPRMQEVAQ